MAQDKYLNDEQLSQFMNQLGGGADQQLPPDAQQQAMEQGAEMAAQDLANAEGGASVPDNAAPPADTGAQSGLSPEVLAEFGVSNADELVNLLRESTGKAGEYKQMLSTLLAYQQAASNKQQLDPTDPMNSVKQAIHEEMAPVFEKLSRDAQNKLVQEAWGEAAREMPDITDMMPEIAEFIKKNPELATANDGLRRAYDGVRSAKYKSEKQLLEDDAFIRQAAANEKVREAVLQAHLGEIARNGEQIPTSIGDGGGTPLTGQKQAPTGMEQAKRGLLGMLGAK